MRKILTVLAVAVFLMTGCSEKKEAHNPQRELSSLVIEGKKPIAFEVETSQTKDEMRMGLMYRKTLPKNQGMIFDIKTPRSISMWMRNTYIPLDIIFVGADKKIIGFQENTKPFSEKFITSPGETLAVIELSAGSVKKHKIKKGDVVKHHILNNI